jgi:glycosyltransferase involved in cell wall biosynthesis
MTLLQTLPTINKDKQGWPWTEEFDAGQYAIHPVWPKITIITPSFNHGEYIEETVRSILLQNYPNLEYIIMDGGSKDNTVEIVEPYQNQITYFVSEKDGGQSNAINKGIKIATGEIINWINSDDYLLPGALFQVGKFFIENPDFALIYGDAITIYPGKRIDDYFAVDYDLMDFVSRISIHQPSAFWKAELFKKVGTIDESLSMCMDYDFWMRIIFDVKHQRLPIKLSAFRRYVGSKSADFDDQSKVYQDYRKVLSRLINSKAPNFKNKLIALDLYHNAENVIYPIQKEFGAATQKAIVNNYILQCGLQEYILGNKKRSIQLLMHAFSAKNIKIPLIFITKNLVGWRKIFHPYRNTR